MLFSCCETLHAGENSLSRAQSLARTPLQKVQHAGLFLFATFLGRMEWFVSSASRTIVEAAHLDLQHAEDSTFRNVSRLTFFERRNARLRAAHLVISADSICVEARLRKSSGPELFSRRNELVQDRDVGDMWYAFIPPRGRTCRH